MLAHPDGSRLLGLFAGTSTYAAADEGERTEDGDVAAYDPAVSLADMTTKARDVLSQDEGGFLLFVEDEGIDSMGHENDGTLLLESMQALADAVEVSRASVAEHRTRCSWSRPRRDHARAHRAAQRPAGS